MRSFLLIFSSPPLSAIVISPSAFSRPVVPSSRGDLVREAGELLEALPRRIFSSSSASVGLLCPYKAADISHHFSSHLVSISLT